MKKHEATILRKARKLIAKPENWTRGTSARDADGNVVVTISPRATCWCAQGAIMRVMDQDDLPWSVFELLHEAAGQPVHVFNDDLGVTHSDVLAVFSKAIKMAEVSK